MKKKKEPLPKEEENVLYDFGFGLVDPKSDFETLARGIGLDPIELAGFLESEQKKNG